MTELENLTAPFPYFGGKRKAELILNSEKLCSRCRDLQAQYTAYDRKKIIGLRERFDVYGWTRRGLNIHLHREREPEFSADRKSVV